jgi:hypothetical protein
MRFSILVLAMALTGCGTILRGTTQEVSIQAPPGTHVVVDDHDQGMGSSTADLKRKSDHLVRIEVAGAPPVEKRIGHHMNGWIAANLLCLPVFIFCGWADIAMGGPYTLDPDEIVVKPSQLAPMPVQQPAAVPQVGQNP